MENQNQPPLPISTPIEQPATEQPVSPPATTPVEVSQSVQEAPKPTKRKLPALKLPKINISLSLRKKIIAGGVVFGLFIIFLLLLPTIIKLMRPTQPVVTVSPTPSPSDAPAEILNPSQYADDEDIKDIEGKINDLDTKLNNISLREETLRVPSVDWEINFK